jgi:chaperonin GroEL (HSP60 family)
MMLRIPEHHFYAAQDTDRLAALHWCAASLPWMTSNSRIDDEETGAEIVRRTLEEPLRQIVANSGEEGAIVVGKIYDSKGSYRNC